MTEQVSALERNAAAVVLASFAGPVVPDWLRRRIEQGVGGVCLFGSNLDRSLPGTEATARVSAALHDVDPSVIVALDEEGGAVTRLEAATGSSVPGNAALGIVDDPDLTRSVAMALGTTLAEAGIDLDLAPCGDVNVDAANPVIGVRSFGADPDVVARHTVAFVAGLQDAGVAACVKHFPGHGSTAVDSHLALPQVDASFSVLVGRELVPFRSAVAAGVASVMTGHLCVPALDPDTPATVSRPILHGLLREQLGFDGVVVTDALDMHGIGGSPQIPARVVEAVAAGADFCCLGSEATDDLVGDCIDALVDAVGEGVLAEERLAEAAARLSRLREFPRVWGGNSRNLAEVGLEAARRALRIEGTLPSQLVGAHVVELRRAEMIAAGSVPWGVATALTELDPATTSERLDRLDGVPKALHRAEVHPLVVVVRDPQTNPETAAILGRLLEARGDAIVVDMGWPQVDGVVPPLGVRITTYGPSRVSGEVVARLLAGQHAPGSGRSTSGDSRN
jgi:beta-N-acetylhexosaminidase